MQTSGVLAVLCCVLAYAFHTQFIASDSNPYVPGKSHSYSRAQGRFSLAYADTTALQGYVAKDYVQLGGYWVKTKFGCITYCNSPDFNGVDGILGFGLPTPGVFGESDGLPPPLFFSLTDKNRADIDGNHILQTRKFSFLSTETAAELQLGGFDPASITGEMFYTNTLAGRHDFSVMVTSVKFGDRELLEFDDEIGTTSLQGIIDSGTSCLVLPDSTLDGKLKDKPYSVFKELEHKRSSFFLEIAGHTLEIPYEIWYLLKSDERCVQRTPSGFPGLLIGDVLFRKYLVQFDLTDPDQPVLGFAKQNPAYTPAPFTSQEDINPKFKLHKQGPRGAIPELGGSRLAGEDPALSIIPIRNKQETQYFINVTIGSLPRQHLTVIFDTGSSVFGVFSKAPPNYNHKSMFEQVGGGSYEVIAPAAFNASALFVVVFAAFALVAFHRPHAAAAVRAAAKRLFASSSAAACRVKAYEPL